MANHRYWRIPASACQDGNHPRLNDVTMAETAPAAGSNLAVLPSAAAASSTYPAGGGLQAWSCDLGDGSAPASAPPAAVRASRAFTESLAGLAPPSARSFRSLAEMAGMGASPATITIRSLVEAAANSVVPPVAVGRAYLELLHAHGTETGAGPSSAAVTASRSLVELAGSSEAPAARPGRSYAEAVANSTAPEVAVARVFAEILTMPPPPG